MINFRVTLVTCKGHCFAGIQTVPYEIGAASLPGFSSPPDVCVSDQDVSQVFTGIFKSSKPQLASWQGSQDWSQGSVPPQPCSSLPV